MSERSGGPEFFVPLELALRAQPVGVAKGIVEAVHIFFVLNEDLVLALEACRDLRGWKG
jgi:hypothetical protein